jgi:hypothetical protein
VQAIFIHNDLRSMPPHNLLRALLIAEPTLDQYRSGRALLRHRLKLSGRIEKK